MSARRWPRHAGHGRRERAAGQSLVEFSLALPIFLLLLLGVFDLGKGVYMYNGVAEAARELSRTTSTHIGSPVGTSSATTDAIAAAKSITPEFGTPAFSCTDLFGSTADCTSGNYVTVAVTAVYRPLSFMGMLAPITLSSTSSTQIP